MKKSERQQRVAYLWKKAMLYGENIWVALRIQKAHNLSIKVKMIADNDDDAYDESQI
jgi:hypothetical protein